MPKRIVLHIGGPKAGSTYLQYVMLNNRDLLRAHGIHYPHDGQGHPGNASLLHQIDEPALEAMLPADVHTLVLSHEDLFHQFPSAEAFAKRTQAMGLEVQIIAFLRPFSQFMFGDYSQFLKQNFEAYLAKRMPYDGRRFEDFVYRRVDRFKPAELLERWDMAFPELPLILAPHTQIRAVFERVLGSDLPLNWEVDPGLTNPSLRKEDCDRVASAIADASLSDEEVRDVMRAAYANARLPDAGKTPALINWVEARFEQHNSALMHYFGYDNRLPRG